MHELYPLYENYDFKSFQQNIQRINRDAIIKYYIENFEKSQFKKILRGDSGIEGIISASNFSFLGGYFNKNIYSLKDFISANHSFASYNDLLQALFADIGRDMDFIMAKVPVNDHNAINALIKNDFYYICTESYLSFDLDRCGEISDKGFEYMSECSGDELERVKEIASTTHENIRYYFDEYFDNQTVDILYQDILEKGFTNKNYRTFVYKENNKIHGFITLIFNTRLSSIMSHNYASLDFIGVDVNSQKKSIGYILNNYALQYLKEHDINIVSVKTMGSNYPALRLLEKNNFFLTSQNAVMHCRRN